MIRYVPLTAIAGTHVPLAAPYPVLDEIGHLPLHDNEVLLASHYYPLVVVIDGPDAGIAALVRRHMLVRDLIGPGGRWIGAYTPISLRAFPFRLATGQITGDPLIDLEIALVPGTEEKPRGMRIRDDDGAPSRKLEAYYEGFRNLAESRQKMRAALDMVLAADVLAPVADAAADRAPSNCHAVDHRRLGRHSAIALEAMSRTTFLPVELAMAMSFSLAQLRSEYRPTTAIADEAPLATGAKSTFGSMETITPWLDTSDLFPGAWAAEPSIWKVAGPTPAGTPSA